MDPRPFFQGNHLVLTAPDSDRDAEIEARWSEDASFQAMIQLEPARPLSPAQVKKKERPGESSQEDFVFAIREPGSQRLIGFIEIRLIEWIHGIGWIRIRIGDPADRRRGLGTEALDLVLRFAFHELNLEHLMASLPGYNFPAEQFFLKAGFKTEVCQQEALLRFGQRWNLLLLGLLKSEWETRQSRGLPGEGRDDGG